MKIQPERDNFVLGLILITGTDYKYAMKIDKDVTNRLKLRIRGSGSYY